MPNSGVGKEGGEGGDPPPPNEKFGGCRVCFAPLRNIMVVGKLILGTFLSDVLCTH